MDGIIAIDKPEGYMSFDIVAIVRKYAKQKKLGIPERSIRWRPVFCLF